jgi:succinate dehydrogenase / fumarate reductase, cytochrome b subunit
MSEAIKKHRSEFKNIHVTQIVRYRMPLSAMVSIMHRISGALIFLLLPFILYLFEKSLFSEIAFENFKGIVSHWLVKLILLALSWAYLHHFCAGIRHLLMDMHIGLSKTGARRTSIAVYGISLPLTALVALKLFGAF